MAGGLIWIFIQPDAVRDGTITVAGPKGHHLARVRRARPGERGTAVCGVTEYDFEVVSVGRDRLEARVLGTRPATSEPGPHLSLLQAALPHPDLDSVLEAATALGVMRFLPVLAERSVARPPLDRRRRWEAIVESAAEQSHRRTVPQVRQVSALRTALEEIRESRLIVLDPAAERPLPPIEDPSRPIVIAVGPEGGWSPAELEEFRRHGAERASLSPFVLRARLAPIAAIAILMHHR
jgi:16S rRNA (uracil1498-N3)-methyltransferase